MAWRGLLALVLLAAHGLVASAVAAQSVSLPPEYAISEHGEWRWASPYGKLPPSDSLREFIDASLMHMRFQLESREPRPILIVQTVNRSAFERVIAHLGGAAAPRYAVAIAFPQRGIMVLDGGRDPRQIIGGYSETVGHELAHLVMGSAGPGVPRWYHEGLAQWLSGARIDWEGHNLLAYLARDEGLVPFSELESFPRTHSLTSIYYRQALGFVADVSRRHGDGVHARILEGLRRGRAMDEAYRTATGEELLAAERAWLRRLAREFSWARAIAQSIGLFHILALVVILGFCYQWWVRRRRLRAMAEEEAALGELDPPIDPRPQHR